MNEDISCGEAYRALTGAMPTHKEQGSPTSWQGGRGGHLRSAGRKRACEHVRAVKKTSCERRGARVALIKRESHATLGGSSLARVQSYAVVSQCMRGQWDSSVAWRLSCAVPCVSQCDLGLGETERKEILRDTLVTAVSFVAIPTARSTHTFIKDRTTEQT